MGYTEKMKKRNWFLVFICAVLILIGLALTVVSIAFMSELGWWSILIGLSGLTTVTAAVLSIIKNDPSFILLGLIIPS